MSEELQTHKTNTDNRRDPAPAPKIDPAEDDLAALHPALSAKYHDIQKIGSGAQATMLRATDEAGNSVAIKVFDLQSAGSLKDLELFEREEETLANIHAEGVPAYIESIRSDRFSYLVEEYIDAPSLEKRMRDGKRYNINEIITILTNAAAILKRIEQAVPPVIHRDIKPANILVGNDLSVHIIDFGVVAAKHQETFAMTFAGTAGYVAPEQLYGKVTPAADIYSLGVTILHLISDVSPCDMHKNNFVFDVDYYMPQNVPQWFVALLKKMITPDLDDRIQDGESLCSYIEAGKDGTLDLNELDTSSDFEDTKNDKKIKAKPNDNLLTEVYHNFKGQLEDQRMYFFDMPAGFLIITFIIFLICMYADLCKGFSVFFQSWIPIQIPISLFFFSIANSNSPAHKPKGTDKLAKTINAYYKSELIEPSGTPEDILYKEKIYIELDTAIQNTNFIIEPLTEEENAKLNKYLSNGNNLKPCICFPPNPVFSGIDLLIHIIFFIFVMAIVFFVIPYFSAYGDTFNYIYYGVCGISLAFYLRFYYRLFKNQIPRLKDEAYQEAYQLYKRRFLLECREEVVFARRKPKKRKKRKNKLDFDENHTQNSDSDN